MIGSFYTLLLNEGLKVAVQTTFKHALSSIPVPSFFNRNNDAKVLIGGVNGAGKTILLDRLQGKINDFYERPNSTRDLEGVRAKTDGVGYRYFDSRGQITIEDLNTVAPSGIIWVFSNGLAVPGTPTIEDYRKITQEQREFEISQLKKAMTHCERICKANGHLWMLVAMSKFDLYASYLENCGYEHAATDELNHRTRVISEILEEAKKGLGDRFIFDIVPFVGLAKDQALGNRKLASVIDSQAERELSRNLREVLNKISVKPK